jgi:hypothetical protein
VRRDPPVSRASDIGTRRGPWLLGLWRWLGGTLLVMLPLGMAHAAPVLSAANLRASDLPAGSKVYSNRLLTGQQLVLNGGSHVFRLRLRGLTAAALEVLVPPSSRPTISVESDLLLYANADAAHADYDLAESARVGDAGDIISIPAIGVAYFARTQAQSSTADREQVIDVVFRRGAVVCLVRVTGLRGKFHAVDVAALGRVVDGRLRVAGY